MSEQQDPIAVLETYRAAMGELMHTLPLAAIAQLAERILAVTQAGHTIYVFGNGGSAATADHMACDLMKNTRTSGAPHVRCISLSAGMPALTAFANDEGYEQAFAGPLRSLARAGDLALAISASGNSPNVLRALADARALGMHTAALLGGAGGAAYALADQAVVIPSHSVPHVEDAHLIVNHMLTECVRTLLRRTLAEQH